jgi:hypothetical protein
LSLQKATFVCITALQIIVGSRISAAIQECDQRNAGEHQRDNPLVDKYDLRHPYASKSINFGYFSSIASAIENSFQTPPHNNREKDDEYVQVLAS